MKDKIQKVKDLLSDKYRWTKDASARTKGGVLVCPTDKNAVKWCLYGAIEKVTHSEDVLNNNFYEISAILENISIKKYKTSFLD